MTKKTSSHTATRVRKAARYSVAAGLLSAVAILFGATRSAAHDDRNSDNTLIVWAGDKAHEAPDFLAVVDFDSGSPHYGKILRIVPLPAGALGTGAVGNEPHHAGLSSDGRTLALGGLLSFLRGQPQVFFFDVSQPRHPKFAGANNPSEASITDEFAPLHNGGFLATFMGGPSGAHPGRVVEYDSHHNLVRTLPILNIPRQSAK